MPVTNSSGSPSDIVLPYGWKLGRHLGEGAQGSVYEVVDANQNDTPWAVKVTLKPAQPKSKTSVEARVNASSLNNEGLLYKAHLKPLRGTIVPNTPEDAQGVRESAGRFVP